MGIEVGHPLIEKQLLHINNVETKDKSQTLLENTKHLKEIKNLLNEQ